MEEASLPNEEVVAPPAEEILETRVDIQEQSSELQEKRSLYDQIAEDIKDKGEFLSELSGSEVEEIMRGVITDLVERQEDIQASVKSMSVKIDGRTGKIEGVVGITGPMNTEIKIDCTLGNERIGEERLQLEKLDINYDVSGWKNKVKLRAAKAYAGIKLKNPNQALVEGLNKQLEGKGVAISDAELHFKGNSLVVKLKG